MTNLAFASLLLCSLSWLLSGCREDSSSLTPRELDGHWIGSYRLKQQGEDEFRPQVAMSFDSNGSFAIRDLNTFNSVEGQYYFEADQHQIHFFVEKNVTQSLNLREGSMMSSMFEFKSQHRLAITTPDRIYELNRASYQLGQQGINGNWICRKDNEIWRLLVDFNDFELVMSMRDGGSYFYRGIVLYTHDADEGDAALSEIKLSGLSGVPERYGFSLEQADIEQDEKGLYYLILTSGLPSRERTKCIRANDVTN